MRRKAASIIYGCLFSLGIFGQQTPIENVLSNIEQNNKELNALIAFKDGKTLELRSGNNLPDPQVGTYYLPYGEHTSGDYTEYQVSQSLEFPTVYGSRRKLIKGKTAQIELDYLAKRQDILSLAKGYCLKITYLNKKLTLIKIRTERAKTIYEQVKTLYEKEQLGVLEMNKAKVAWLQEQFKVHEVENDLKNLHVLLQTLNGGNDISFESAEYSGALEKINKDSLWQEKLALDPRLQDLHQQQIIAGQELRLAKNKSLPNLSIGFNSQGVSGERYSGLYGGISIPLWSNQNKVKAAQFQMEYQESLTTSKMIEAHALFEKEYNDFVLMSAKFQEYQSTFSELSSDDLLLKAYQLGELSFMEYYMELQFYREAYDDMLEMQYQLYISQNNLFKHRL